MKTRKLLLASLAITATGMMFALQVHAVQSFKGHWTIDSNGTGKAIQGSVHVTGGSASWTCDGTAGVCASVGGDGTLIINDSPDAGPDNGSGSAHQ